jgi:hypothetical protein
MKPLIIRVVACALLLLCASNPADARVERVEVLSRADVLDGRPFETVGAYEKLLCRVHFTLRPDHPRNQVIVDLDLAPRDTSGDVEFTADLYLLRPKQMDHGNGAVLLEIPNRGGKGMLALFNSAAGSLDPTTAEHFGNGFLMRQGFTLAWLGWQADVRDQPGLLHLQAPVARPHGGIRGLVRADFSVSERVFDHPLGHVIGGAIGGTGYPVADATAPENVLTVRESTYGERTVIPRARWTFGRTVDGKAIPDPSFVTLDGGFEPGRIYELVYVAEDPRIIGVGFAAVRDLVSYFKHDEQAPVHVRVAYAMGVSQCGRFLRHFLFQGFNADEQDRQVLDGVFVDVAGAGRGSFNHRFGQSSRDAQPFSSVYYPTDIYPFTDRPYPDPVAGVSRGLLDRAVADGVAPKIFYTNTSYEYWSRAASLTHTTPDGSRDAEIPPNARIYVQTGFAHISGPFPPRETRAGDLRAQNPINPLPEAPFWRALLMAMHEWVTAKAEPPASRYPRLSDGTLVTLGAWHFPTIPDVTRPTTTNLAFRLDFGPDFESRGIISKEPPAVGTLFPVFVPKSDDDGMDIAGVRLPELSVPLATYTGWNLRDPATGAAHERVSFAGSYFPFARTRAERTANGDPRRSLEERYGSREEYIGRYTEAALQLLKDRFLLAEDLAGVVERGEREWEYAVSTH